MPGGFPNLINVQGANTLLDAGRTCIWCGFDASHVWNERHHASNHKHKGRVLANQGCARDNGVTLGLKEIEPAPLNFSGLHALALWRALFRRSL